MFSVWWSKWNPISERERDSLDFKWKVSKIRQHHPHMNAVIYSKKRRGTFVRVQFGGSLKKEGRGSGARVRAVLSPVFLEMIEMFRLVCQQIASAPHVICRPATLRERFTFKCECVFKWKGRGHSFWSGWKKETGSDRDMNTEGERRDEGRFLSR